MSTVTESLSYAGLTEMGGLSVDEMLREFPQLSPAQVYDALSYYYDYREDIDREVAELTDLEQAARRHPPTLMPPDGRA